MQLQGPDLARPAPAAQYSALRQAGTDLGADSVKASRRTAGAIELPGTVSRRGYLQAHTQRPRVNP